MNEYEVSLESNYEDSEVNFSNEESDDDDDEYLPTTDRKKECRLERGNCIFDLEQLLESMQGD